MGRTEREEHVTKWAVLLNMRRLKQTHSFIHSLTHCRWDPSTLTLSAPLEMAFDKRTNIGDTCDILGEHFSIANNEVRE